MSVPKKLLLTVALLCAGVSTHVAAESGGTIHFVGMIVEPPCNVNVDYRHVVMACDRQGEAKTQQYSLDEVAQGQDGYDNLATMQLSYVNPQHTLAVLNVNYN